MFVATYIILYLFMKKISGKKKFKKIWGGYTQFLSTRRIFD